MCGRMPCILFHMPYSKNYHIRIDPDLMWMMAHANEFSDSGNWDSAVASSAAPFDVSEVTFDGWHFTCNNPQSQWQVAVRGDGTSGDGSSDFRGKAQQACRDYVASTMVLTAPETGASDPFAGGANFIPLGDVQMSAAPPVNSAFWTRRQGFSDDGETMLID